MDRKKRCAVVTGGNKGIGLETCRQLALNDGIEVILTTRDSALILSPYVITQQTTVIRTPSTKVESFTRVEPSSQIRTELKYGPYENQSPYSYTHWGNLQITEHYTLVHNGAKHKGGLNINQGIPLLDLVFLPSSDVPKGPIFCFGLADYTTSGLDFSESHCLRVQQLRVADMGEAVKEAGVIENLRSVVFKISESLEGSCAKIQGYDFNNGIDYSQILKSLISTGFQASNLGDAIETVNQMTRINESPPFSTHLADLTRSFENSYIPENLRTPKPLTFSKNRLRGAKNRSNISPVAKFFFSEKTIFFSKNFAYVQTFFLCICAHCTYAQKIKKSCTYAKVKKKYRFFGNFFQRIVMIKNVLEGSEVGSRSGEKFFFGENFW
ncbi:hypothetical protein LXL04_004471 [Taraxacum kok-saghyz]